MKGKPASRSFTAICIGLVATISLQCSSAKRSSVTHVGPDVSQAPTDINTSPDDQMPIDPRQTEYLRKAKQADSTAQKITAPEKDTRVLHFSTADFTIYDAPHDSAVHKSRESPRKADEDSTVHDHDVAVGILTQNEIQSLALNLSKTEIICLSLVDRELFENFEKEDLEKKFSHYGAKYLLLAVSKADSEQRSAFMIKFYQARIKNNSIEKAFETALKDANQHHSKLDFKARLLKK